MTEILQLVLKISILFFMVGNMAEMGAQLAMAEAFAACWYASHPPQGKIL